MPWTQSWFSICEKEQNDFLSGMKWISFAILIRIYEMGIISIIKNTLFVVYYIKDI